MPKASRTLDLLTPAKASEQIETDPLFNVFYWKCIALALTFNILTTFVVIAILFGTGFVKNSFGDVVKKFQTEITITTHKKVGNITQTTTEKRPISHLLKPMKEFLGISIKQPINSKIFDNLITGVIVEEIVYRFPIRFLIGFLVFLNIKSNRLLKIMLWTVGLSLNLYWAFSIHTNVNPLLWIPVFFAGIAWLWLVIKTKRLWPAIFCHAAANLNIYFLIKIYQLF